MSALNTDPLLSQQCWKIPHKILMEPKAKSLHRDCTCGVCPFLFSQQCRSHQSPFSEQLNYGWTDVWILGWQVLVMCLLAQLQGCMTSNLYGCIQPDHDVHLTLMETVKIFKVDHNYSYPNHSISPCTLCFTSDQLSGDSFNVKDFLLNCILSELRKFLRTWFGEFCSCCCLPLLPQLACSILATTYKELIQVFVQFLIQ